MNNNYENTIESFIEFCDEMKIAEEGFSVKDFINGLIDRLKDLLDKIKLFVAKMTKNKEVEVNEEFYKNYDWAKGQLNSAHSQLQNQVCDGHIQTYWIDRTKNSALKSLNDLSSMSARHDGNGPAKTINLYEIYKGMIETQKYVNSEIQWLKRLGKDDDFERLELQTRISILNTEVRLYTTVYNKINKL